MPDPGGEAAASFLFPPGAGDDEIPVEPVAPPPPPEKTISAKRVVQMIIRTYVDPEAQLRDNEKLRALFRHIAEPYGPEEFLNFYFLIAKISLLNDLVTEQSLKPQDIGKESMEWIVKNTSHVFGWDEVRGSHLIPQDEASDGTVASPQGPEATSDAQAPRVPRINVLANLGNVTPMQIVQGPRVPQDAIVDTSAEDQRFIELVDRLVPGPLGRREFGAMIDDPQDPPARPTTEEEREGPLDPPDSGRAEASEFNRQFISRVHNYLNRIRNSEQGDRMFQTLEISPGHVERVFSRVVESMVRGLGETGIIDPQPTQVEAPPVDTEPDFTGQAIGEREREDHDRQRAEEQEPEAEEPDPGEPSN